ncbi:hypothetical protein [Pandoravirus japonicus]|uniref:Uncharacterized protein n=1 Tax=Pandoravirus japonicus TaxID=2823154 RepID=A0A811BP42_9VIRU|nr:hypothetical protein [Pandoravirus japonicus]
MPLFFFLKRKVYPSDGAFLASRPRSHTRLFFCNHKETRAPRLIDQWALCAFLSPYSRKNKPLFSCHQPAVVVCGALLSVRKKSARGAFFFFLVGQTRKNMDQ